MGIDGFFGRYANQRYTNCFQDRIPRPVVSLNLDMNAEIHGSVKKVYHEGGSEAQLRLDHEKNPENMQRDLFRDVFSDLKNYCEVCKPQKLLHIAMDGPTNMGKMWQQKGRRYKAEKDRRRPGWHTVFDRNAISPGTVFMSEFDIALRQFLLDNERIIPVWLNYSPHLANGEGEHKIFDFFRRHARELNEPVTDDRGERREPSHIIIGSDSDLVMLSLLSPVNNIYLVRNTHDATFTTRGGEVKENYRNVVNIEEVKLKVLEDVEGAPGTNFEKIRDFVTLCSFVGNDFLPKMRIFKDPALAIEILVKNYVAVGKPLTDDRGIDFSVLSEILERIQPLNRDILKGLVFRHQSDPAIDEYATASYETREEKKNADRKLRQSYYNFLIFKDPAVQQFAKKALGPTNFTQFAINLAKEFIKTFQWVFLYYTKGNRFVSQTWYYKHLKAPLLEDVIEACHLVADELCDVESKQDEYFFKALHQLLAVMPPGNANLLPKAYQPLLSGTDGSTKTMAVLADQAPIDFTVDFAGTDAEHQGKANVPPIDMRSIVVALGKMKTYPSELGEKPDQEIRRAPKMHRHYNRGFVHFKEMIDPEGFKKGRIERAERAQRENMYTRAPEKYVAPEPYRPPAKKTPLKPVRGTRSPYVPPPHSSREVKGEKTYDKYENRSRVMVLAKDAFF